MKINEVVMFPVSVTLSKKNPYSNSVKVNNILVSVTNPIRINTLDELNRLLPIEKYIVIEYIKVKEEKKVKDKEIKDKEVKTKKSQKKSI